MSPSSLPLLLSSLLLLLLHGCPVRGLSQDGVLLLSFKYSLLADPVSALADWSYADDSPCSWNGVTCMGFPPADLMTTFNSSGNGTASSSAPRFPITPRVVSLVLPNAQLLGSVTPELGLIEHLRRVDLSGNFLNGTLPVGFFNATDLRALVLADNDISGELPELIGKLEKLHTLNLAGNALTGRVPAGLTLLPFLAAASLANNYFSGELPGGGFDSMLVLDLSSNLLNGSLPPNLGGSSLRYLNLSCNRLTGAIPPELGTRLPASATIDLAFNNLTGEIPQLGVFLTQKPAAFAGNADLCGKPLGDSCAVPSTLPYPPPIASTAAPPAPKPPAAIAAIPKRPNGDSSAGGGGGGGSKQGGLRQATILEIAAGDLGGIALLCVVFFYVYQVKRRNQQQQQPKQPKQKSGKSDVGVKRVEKGSEEEEEPSALAVLSRCLRKTTGIGRGGGTEESSETSASSESEFGAEETKAAAAQADLGKPRALPQQQKQEEGAVLVTVDGETELELETLLKASAYILGAAGSSIIYKAVLADGTAFAVRRIGEGGGGDKLKDFDAQVRAIAKFRHPNLLRLRGFYWGADEKLLIHDYARNGSLGGISFRKKLGSSPFHLSWDARLMIARGIARGLVYIHEKKGVHGNIKPSNILLSAELEPMIGDFGLERLLPGDSRHRPGTPGRQFGSKRSVQSLPDLSLMAPGASPCASSSSTAALAPQPYQPPESLKSLRPNAKWDVYAFGMVLLELLAGRVFSEVELCQWSSGIAAEERGRVLRMVDPALRGEVQGEEEEEALLSCFMLGFSCCSMAPQKRPSMKEALHVLDRMTIGSSPFSYS